MVNENDVGELRARLKELEGRIEFIYRHFGLEYVKEPSQADRPVADALRSGGELAAIKLYREIHGVDLASAKAAVEEIGRRSGS